MHISTSFLYIFATLSLTMAIPGKSNVYHLVDSAESEWTWIARLSDRYKFNAEAQKVLHNRLVMNYMRPIPKAPKIITEEEPISVLLWDTEGLEKVAGDTELASQCSVPCRVTTDRSESGKAHMILAVGDEVPDVFAILQPFQQKALFVLEPDLSLPNAEKRVDPFHMLVSYSRHSDIRVDYSRSLSIPSGLPVFAQKTKKALAAAFISNCDNNGDARYRLDYLRELSVHMDIDSYGACLHTPGLPTDVNFKEIASQYHYVLVLENTVLDDYVTDKFYEALSTDAIPVYLGAPNIAEFLPDRQSNHIVIEARNFPDPTGLATHLKELALDEKAYMEYFEWRSVGHDPSFSKQNDFEATGKNSFVCRMCEHYNLRVEK
ncbi:Alpha-(1,3)-fucosyltransferase [Paramicrosporidium saccamoebae]|uniref:Fucosyltransferase n=1 Tax=Paramicrosporidium saccamoebae TaxID=1246581 RepID=A0A2H9TMG1_9FUNG|nr:Alpha-(1,3)-fucosyltransferase [Paramicrosporidium saccamoebae]